MSLETRKADGFTGLDKEQLITVLTINYGLVSNIDKVYNLRKMESWYKKYKETRDHLIFLPDAFIVSLYVYEELSKNNTIYDLIKSVITNTRILAAVQIVLFNGLGNKLLNDWHSRQIIGLDKSLAYQEILDIIYSHKEVLYSMKLDPETIAYFIVPENCYLIEITSNNKLLLHTQTNSEIYGKECDTSKILRGLDGYTSKSYYEQQVIKLRLEEYIRQELKLGILSQSIRIPHRREP